MRDETVFTHHELFDRRTGEFKPYRPGARLSRLDQYLISHAVLTLDGERIRELWTRLKIWPAGDMSAPVFWATVHMIRLGLVNATVQQKRESEDWLLAHGFTVPEPLKPK